MSEKTIKSNRSRFSAIVQLRCPRCREGKVFSGSLTMNEKCPECEHVFEEEPGYFLGAMYVSYPISVAMMGVFWGIVLLLSPGLSSLYAVPISAGLFLPFIPMTFRYSRVIWMHLTT